MKLKGFMLSLTLLIVLSSTLFLAGCPAPERRPAPPPPNVAPDQNRNMPDMQNENGQDRLQNEDAEVRPLENMILNMPEVDNVWMILSGNTAYIAIDLKDNVDDQQATEVKKEIARQVKTAQGAPSEITNVIVTADPDIVPRIRRVAEGTANGQPLSSFANEMAEIIRRLNPTNR